MIGRLNLENSSQFQLLQKARKDLISEIEAIMQYDDHIQSTQNQTARQTWADIRNEELTHVGELLALISYLNPEQKQYVESGVKEFNERLNN